MERALTLAVGAAALVAACILGTSPDELGLTCRFTGDDGTACGACIAGSCRAAVDACCRESACLANAMPALDACSRGEGCAKLLAQNGDLSSCVRASCASACGGGDGGGAGDFVVSCVEASSALGNNGCRCDALSPFADAGAADGLAPTTSCGPGSFGSASSACCAFAGWPDGGACVCEPVRCEEVTSNLKSCVCGLLANSSDFTETITCSLGQPCCSKAGSCACNGDTCQLDETQVTSCEAHNVAKTVTCDNGARVERCR